MPNAVCGRSSSAYVHACQPFSHPRSVTHSLWVPGYSSVSNPQRGQNTVEHVERAKGSYLERWLEMVWKQFMMAPKPLCINHTIQSMSGENPPNPSSFNQISTHSGRT
jgi:hypothetical protein